MNKNLERFYDGIKNGKNFLLFDLEANCLVDETTEVPFTYNHETIQIGYVKFDSQFRPIIKGSIFIRPTKLNILSDFIKNLTGITQEQVDAGMTFEKGLSQFLGHFNRENDYLMSFGYYDIKQIFKDCQLNNIPYPFDEGNEWQYSKHINIKNALAKKLDIREKGMDSLMIHLGLKLKGRHHNGEDDCLNIFEIIKHIFAS